MDLTALKRRSVSLDWIALALALVFLGISAWAGTEKPATLVIYLLVALMEVAAAAGGLNGVSKAQSPRALGEAQVLASWWIVSVGFAGLLLFPSSFFHVAATPVALIVCVVWILVGGYSLLVLRRETDVPLSP